MKNSKTSPRHTGDASDLDLLGEVACTNTALRRAARRLGNLYDEALAPISLKATQIGMLAQISRFPSADGHNGPTLQELAGLLAIQMSAISHAMKPLVRDGIVELQQDALDKRTKHCVLTPKGDQLLAEALVLWQAANERVETVLGPSSAALLRQLADEIASDEFLSEFNHLTAE